MSLVILKSRAEMESASRSLRSRGLGPSRFPDGYARGVAYVIRTRSRLPPPEWRKAWDLEKTISLIESAVPQDATVLDLGAFNSAVIPALARLGYTNIVGIDLDPRVRCGARRDVVRYVVADFHETGLIDGSCDVVTAMSTIEHGWQGNRLLSEVSRLLRPGGLFIASTDYWPDKIDTSGVMAFGLPWIIFSEQEMRGLIAAAATHNLLPAGVLDFSAVEPVISWSGRTYTFAHLVLKRV
jgi:SAM-dependent methyltransferase